MGKLYGEIHLNLHCIVIFGLPVTLTIKGINQEGGLFPVMGRLPLNFG